MWTKINIHYGINVKIASRTIFSTSFLILCFVDGASRYIRVLKINLMHYLSSVYF